MTDSKEYDLICIGVSLIDSIIKGFDPNPISKTGFFAESGSLALGGEAFNGAVTASRLGLKTAIITGIGTDLGGDIIKAELEKNHVDTTLSLCSEDIKTPVSTMFVNDDGTRKSITNKSHRYNFHPEQNVGALEKCSAITVASLFRAPFDDRDVIYSVLKHANDLGVMTFVDTKLPNSNRLSLDDIRDSLAFVDYIFPNEDEAEYYSGEKDPDKQADVFLGYGIKNVIVKLGGRGCLFKNKTERIMLPPIKAEVVDATGAGDNFLAGFAACRIWGQSDKDALIFANTCGGICTEYVGATTGIQSADQVYERMLS